MRKFLITATLAVFTSFPQPAAAGDIEIIMDHVHPQKIHDALRKSTAKAITQIYVAKLLEYAVKITDPDRVQAMIPVATIDNTIRMMRGQAAERCFDSFSDLQLQRAAADIQRYPSSTRKGEWREFRGIRNKVHLEFAGCYQKIRRSLRDNVLDGTTTLPSGSSKVLASILESGDLATYPNRTVRQNLIAKLRASDL